MIRFDWHFINFFSFFYFLWFVFTLVLIFLDLALYLYLSFFLLFLNSNKSLLFNLFFNLNNWYEFIFILELCEIIAFKSLSNNDYLSFFFLFFPFSHMSNIDEYQIWNTNIYVGLYVKKRRRRRRFLLMTSVYFKIKWNYNQLICINFLNMLLILDIIIIIVFKRMRKKNKQTNKTWGKWSNKKWNKISLKYLWINNNTNILVEMKYFLNFHLYLYIYFGFASNFLKLY